MPMLICQHIFYGCLPTTPVEMNSCSRDWMVPKYLLYDAFHQNHINFYSIKLTHFTSKYIEQKEPIHSNLVVKLNACVSVTWKSHPYTYTLEKFLHMCTRNMQMNGIRTVQRETQVETISISKKFPKNISCIIHNIILL